MVRIDLDGKPTFTEGQLDGIVAFLAMMEAYLNALDSRAFVGAEMGATEWASGTYNYTKTSRQFLRHCIRQAELMTDKQRQSHNGTDRYTDSTVQACK